MVDFQMKYHPTILIQYMPNGSLANLIVNNHKFPLSKKYIILLGIAEGMKYLHSIGIIHRDLKPANVMLDSNFYPYICDFGESKMSELSISSIFMLSYKGSPAYMAPEIMAGHKYTYKSDIYSFAILMYELLTNKKPYPNYVSVFRLQHDVSNGTRPDLTFIKDQIIRNFLIKCW